jgi:hypothetical protein
MWKWIQNFLDEILAKCLVNNTEGEWFKTSIGLPQGAVIFPILFCIDVDSPFSTPFHNFIDVLLYTFRNFY